MLANGSERWRSKIHGQWDDLMAIDPKHRATKADNTIPLSFDDLVRGVLFTDPKTLPTRKKAAKKKAAAKSKKAKAKAKG